jgi:toxin ParE1/3/4
VRLTWNRFALDDLDSIRDYIARERPRAAAQVAARIKSAAAMLASFPGAGRAGRVDGTREHPVAHTPYVLVYAAAGGTVEILRGLHGASDWPPEE